MIPSRLTGCMITAACVFFGGVLGTCLGFWMGSGTAPSQRVSEEWIPGTNLLIQGGDYLALAIKAGFGGLVGAAGGLATALVGLNRLRRRNAQ